MVHFISRMLKLYENTFSRSEKRLKFLACTILTKYMSVELKEENPDADSLSDSFHLKERNNVPTSFYISLHQIIRCIIGEELRHDESATWMTRFFVGAVLADTSEFRMISIFNPRPTES